MRRDRRRESLLNASTFYHSKSARRVLSLDGGRVRSATVGPSMEAGAAIDALRTVHSGPGCSSDSECDEQKVVAELGHPPPAAAVFRRALSSEADLEGDAAAAATTAGAATAAAVPKGAAQAPPASSAERRRRLAELAKRRAAQLAARQQNAEPGQATPSGAAKLVTQQQRESLPGEAGKTKRPEMARKGSTRAQNLRCKGWFVLQATPQQLPRVFQAMKQHSVTRFQAVFDGAGGEDIEQTLIILGC